MGVLDLDPSRVVVLRFQQRDLRGDVILVHVCLVVDVELFEVLGELLCSRLADSLGLLDQVISHLIPAVVVHFICLFIKHDLIVSLVKDSFSHVLIFFQSHHLFNILLDDDHKVFVSLLLLGDGLLRGVVLGSSPGEFVLELEELGDVLSSHFLQLFVDR